MNTTPVTLTAGSSTRVKCLATLVGLVVVVMDGVSTGTGQHSGCSSEHPIRATSRLKELDPAKCRTEEVGIAQAPVRMAWPV